MLLGKGSTQRQVPEALLLEDDSVRSHWARYRRGGLGALRKDNYSGGLSYFNAVEVGELDTHLQEHLTVQEVVTYVENRFGVAYTLSGMTDRLKRPGFVYKKPKVVPGKADPLARQRFENLEHSKGEQDPVYFMDGAHTQHNTMAAYGWIKQGEEQGTCVQPGRLRNFHPTVNGMTISDPTAFSVYYRNRLNKS